MKYLLVIGIIMSLMSADNAQAGKRLKDFPQMFENDEQRFMRKCIKPSQLAGYEEVPAYKKYRAKGFYHYEKNCKCLSSTLGKAGFSAEEIEAWGRLFDGEYSKIGDVNKAQHKVGDYVQENDIFERCGKHLDQ